MSLSCSRTNVFVFVFNFVVDISNEIRTNVSLGENAHLDKVRAARAHTEAALLGDGQEIPTLLGRQTYYDPASGYFITTIKIIVQQRQDGFALDLSEKHTNVNFQNYENTDANRFYE